MTDRMDWRSLFVHDPATGITSLVRSATLEDVAERLGVYLRWLHDGQRTRHFRPEDGVSLETENGLALSAAEIALEPEGWRRLNPADLERMAHVVIWALKESRL